MTTRPTVEERLEALANATGEILVDLARVKELEGELNTAHDMELYEIKRRETAEIERDAALELVTEYEQERDSALLRARRWKISAKKWRRKAEFRAGDIEMVQLMAHHLKEKLADAREELDVVAERGCYLCSGKMK